MELGVVFFHANFHTKSHSDAIHTWYIQFYRRSIQNTEKLDTDIRQTFSTSQNTSCRVLL